MSYEADIYKAIKACASVWSAIGGRFSWDVADSTTAAPYIVAQTVSDSNTSTFGSVGGASFPTVQITCWAASKLQASDIMKSLVNEIDTKDLPGDSQTSLAFDSRTSTYDNESRLFGCVIRFRASVQFS